MVRREQVSGERGEAASETSTANRRTVARSSALGLRTKTTPAAATHPHITNRTGRCHRIPRHDSRCSASARVACCLAALTASWPTIRRASRTASLERSTLSLAICP